ncbi:hypothetical protein AHAS_Ahas07G0059200 [Arachis hypogaea]
MPKRVAEKLIALQRSFYGLKRMEIMRRELFQWELALVNQLHERYCRHKLFQRKSQVTISLVQFGEAWFHQELSSLHGVVAWLTFFDRAWVISGTIKELFESWRGEPDRKVMQDKWLVRFFAVIWNIWRERNARIFMNEEGCIEDIKLKSVQSCKEWSGADPCG